MRTRHFSVMWKIIVSPAMGMHRPMAAEHPSDAGIRIATSPSAPRNDSDFRTFPQ